MAELSFGHNLRAKRKELEGPAANTVEFKGAPQKMLGIALHEYGSSHMLKVQLCNLPSEISDTEILIKVVLGCDWSGTVVKAGKNTKYQPGDQLFGRQTLDRIRQTNGSYAEFCVVDGAECCAKPSALSFEEAASVPWAGLTALAALTRVGGLTEGASTPRAVLVLGGSGGVGCYAVQLAKHHLKCWVAATCSGANAPFIQALGADKVYNYRDGDWWSEVKKPEGSSGKGFDVVLDCVGGDDYWEKGRELLCEGGSYVTLVGACRYGEQELSVGGAFNAQLQTSFRKGLGILGAQSKYTLFTPSMTNSADLRTLAALLQKRTIIPVVKKVYSMYEIFDAHDTVDSHHAVGKTIIQVGKDGDEHEEEEEEDDGSEPDEDDRLDSMDELKRQQMAVAARLKQMKAGGGGAGAGGGNGGVLAGGGGNSGLDDEDVDWLKQSGAAGLLAELDGSPAFDKGPRKKKGWDDDHGKGRKPPDQPRSVSFAGLEEEGEGGASKLSKKEQYRLAVLKEKQAQSGGTEPEDEDEDEDGDEHEGAGKKGVLPSAEQLRTMGSVSHAGTLRRKKEDHGRFEDPYKTVCHASLDLGVLTLQRMAGGEPQGEPESFDLGQGWSLESREDKTDRFVLTRKGPVLDASESAQVTLKAGSKAEGKVWIEKLRETKYWFDSRERKFNGLKTGQVPTATSSAAPDNSAFVVPKKALDPAHKCGVGMVLKQCDGYLEVKRLADGGGAAKSGKIFVGDILLKVDGRSVVTAEAAAAAIVGQEGTAVKFDMQRPGEGRSAPSHFTIYIKRQKPANAK